MELFPEGLSSEDIPMVIFSLTEPIRSKIFNYNKFVSSIDFNQAINDLNTIVCKCNEFEEFKDPHHCHVITGNLNLIANNKLRNLIKKTYHIKKIKVGHAGTLDPLATGILILCIGKKN